MKKTRRVLLAKRISDSKGERSDSIGEQDRKLRERAAKEPDVVAVGDTEDLSVSGDIDMFARPRLGKWLQPHRLGEWDELWVSTQDRLSRSEPHFMAFVFKAIEWEKKIIVLDDSEFTSQMQTPEGRAILHVKSLGPHKELERIKQRVQDSHDLRRYTKRWPGGIPPFGYVPVKRYEDGKTATYIELDTDMMFWLHEMRRNMVDDPETSFTGIAAHLDDREVLTARDRARVRKGKPVKRRGGAEGERERWSDTGVKNLLTDEALLGYKKHNREVLHDDDGQPIRLAEPIFDDHEWATLQAAVQRRLRTTTPRVNGTSPMYGVVRCSKCNAKATHKVTVHERRKSVRAATESQAGDDQNESTGMEFEEVTYRYYQCGAWPKSARCKGISCRAEDVEEMVEIHFLQEHGNAQVTKRIWVAGQQREGGNREDRGADHSPSPPGRRGGLGRRPRGLPESDAAAQAPEERAGSSSRR